MIAISAIAHTSIQKVFTVDVAHIAALRRQECRDVLCQIVWDRLGGYMKRIRIILSSGKEVSFIAEDNFTTRLCKDVNTYTAPSGTSYNFARQDIAATIISSMVHCPHCGRNVIPEQIGIEAESKPIISFLVCPDCRERIDAQ